jgi:hypothetical protein
MTKTPRIGFGIANVLVAAVVAWGVFRGLPTRWWPVDIGAAVVTALMGPDDVRGGVPGSAVDLQLRIDHAQHAGSMMVRWLAMTSSPSR